MTESELHNLETQVDNLIDCFQQLNRENISLQKKIADLKHDHIALLEQKKKTAQEIKSIIIQLQDELSCQTQ